MRFRSGITVLVASQPALPSFTATVHYKAGQANEWQGLFGAAELAGRLLLDGTDRIGTRDPKLEASLLLELDRIDPAMRRKRQALELMDPDRAAALKPEIATLAARQEALLETLTANSMPRLYARLYQERGASGPEIRVTPTEIQYTVTLPSDQLSFFLAMEGARMDSFTSRGFYAARAALAAQRRQEQLEPGYALLRGLTATAFQVHPFGRYQADPASIEGIDRGELELFSRVHLRPAQTVLVLAGGVRGADVRALADKYLSDLAPGPNPGPIEPVEPPQDGERRIDVEGAGPTEVLLAFHREAAGLRAGDPMLPVLLELLGDPRDGMLAGLERRGLARRVVATEYPPSPPLGTLYPSLVVVGATAARTTGREGLEQALLSILADLAEHGPTPEALEGARRRVQARIALAMGDPTQLAPMLARAFATVDDEAALSRLYQRAGEVRIDQVKAAAARLFAATNRTVGVKMPPLAVAAAGGELAPHESSSLEEAAERPAGETGGPASAAGTGAHPAEGEEAHGSSAADGEGGHGSSAADGEAAHGSSAAGGEGAQGGSAAAGEAAHGSSAAGGEGAQGGSAAAGEAAHGANAPGETGAHRDTPRGEKTTPTAAEGLR
jgi:predicted Zn-dependent peptidase